MTPLRLFIHVEAMCESEESVDYIYNILQIGYSGDNWDSNTSIEERAMRSAIMFSDNFDVRWYTRQILKTIDSLKNNKQSDQEIKSQLLKQLPSLVRLERKF